MTEHRSGADHDGRRYARIRLREFARPQGYVELGIGDEIELCDDALRHPLRLQQLSLTVQALLIEHVRCRRIRMRDLFSSRVEPDHRRRRIPVGHAHRDGRSNDCEQESRQKNDELTTKQGLENPPCIRGSTRKRSGGLIPDIETGKLVLVVHVHTRGNCQRSFEVERASEHTRRSPTATAVTRRIIGMGPLGPPSTRRCRRGRR